MLKIAFGLLYQTIGLNQLFATSQSVQALTSDEEPGKPIGKHKETVTRKKIKRHHL
jgi:hypothetical protein